MVQPNYNGCIVDPDVTNSASIRCFEKAGFSKIIQIDQAIGRSLLLMSIQFN